MRIHEVKINYKALAEAMGDGKHPPFSPHSTLHSFTLTSALTCRSECTPKALIHRFAKIKSAIGPNGDKAGGDDGEPASTNGTPTKPVGRKKAPATPKAKKNGEGNADGSPSSAAKKRKSGAIKLEDDDADAKGINGVAGAEKDGEPPSKKAKTACAARKNIKGIKSGKAGVVKQEESDVALGDMQFELQGVEAEEGEGNGAVKDEE